MNDDEPHRSRGNRSGRTAPIRLDAMAFRAAATPIGSALLQTDGLPLHVAGRVRRNPRNGGRPQLLVDDAARG